MKRKAKVSIISTVKDEEESIRDLLDSIFIQSYKPGEVIIVDGGSTDKTIDIIKEYQKKNKMIKLISSPGASRMRGRNIAIKNAKNEIIATTDGGCVLDKDWLKNLVKRIEKGAKAVAGNSSPNYKNLFERCQGELLLGNKFLPPTFNGNVFPSARSEAFLKKVWRDAGGYSEGKPADDGFFHFKVSDAGYRYVQAEDAVVRWRLRKTWKSLFRQFFSYSKWDAQSGLLVRQPRSMALIFGFYVYVLALLYSLLVQNLTLVYVLIALLFLYGLIPAIEVTIKTKNLKSLFYGFGIQFTRRFAYISGYHYGLFSKKP